MSFNHQNHPPPGDNPINPSTPTAPGVINSVVISSEEQSHLDSFLDLRSHELYKRRLLNTHAIQGTMERICPRDRIKLDKDAVTAMREIVTEFIGLITSETVERVRTDGRATMDGDDIIDAMRAFGFGPAYTATMEHGLYLQRAEKNNSKKPKIYPHSSVNSYSSNLHQQFPQSHSQIQSQSQHQMNQSSQQQFQQQQQRTNSNSNPNLPQQQHSLHPLHPLHPLQFQPNSHQNQNSNPNLPQQFHQNQQGQQQQQQGHRSQLLPQSQQPAGQHSFLTIQQQQQQQQQLDFHNQQLQLLQQQMPMGGVSNKPTMGNEQQQQLSTTNGNQSRPPSQNSQNFKNQSGNSGGGGGGGGGMNRSQSPIQPGNHQSNKFNHISAENQQQSLPQSKLNTPSSSSSASSSSSTTSASSSTTSPSSSSTTSPSSFRTSSSTRGDDQHNIDFENNSILSVTITNAMNENDSMTDCITSPSSSSSNINDIDSTVTGYQSQESNSDNNDYNEQNNNENNEKIPGSGGSGGRHRNNISQNNHFGLGISINTNNGTNPGHMILYGQDIDDEYDDDDLVQLQPAHQPPQQQQQTGHPPQQPSVHPLQIPQSQTLSKQQIHQQQLIQQQQQPPSPPQPFQQLIQEQGISIDSIPQTSRLSPVLEQQPTPDQQTTKLTPTPQQDDGILEGTTGQKQEQQDQGEGGREGKEENDKKREEIETPVIPPRRSSTRRKR